MLFWIKYFTRHVLVFSGISLDFLVRYIMGCALVLDKFFSRVRIILLDVLVLVTDGLTPLTHQSPKFSFILFLFRLAWGFSIVFECQG